MKNCLKKVWMLSVLLSLALLTACSDDNSNFYRVYPYDNGGGGVTVPEDEGGKYKEKEVRVNRGGTYDGQVTLRFYDAQPNVAYMSIAAFYRMMLPNATMKLEKQGGMYVLTTDNGKVVSQVAVNVYDDYLETLEDYSIIDFTNLMSINQQGMPNVYYDGAPFVKYKDLTATGASKSTTLNFKKYSIDLHGDASNVYFPFSTLSERLLLLLWQPVPGADEGLRHTHHRREVGWWRMCHPADVYRRRLRLPHLVVPLPSVRCQRQEYRWWRRAPESPAS